MRRRPWHLVRARAYAGRLTSGTRNRVWKRLGADNDGGASFVNASSPSSVAAFDAAAPVSKDVGLSVAVLSTEPTGARRICAAETDNRPGVSLKQHRLGDPDDCGHEGDRRRTLILIQGGQDSDDPVQGVVDVAYWVKRPPGRQASTPWRPVCAAILLQQQAVRVVDQPIQNSIGDGWIADHLMPVIDRQLAGDDGRAAIVAGRP